jgi:Na+-transporting methylmalonyl-CoA/oxaloacetate decarboxylase beta subunit
MNFKIDFGKVFTALTIALILFLVGAIWDFQILKSRVSATENKLLGIDEKIGIVAEITCTQAVNNQLPDASKICHDVLKQKQRQ